MRRCDVDVAAVRPQRGLDLTASFPGFSVGNDAPHFHPQWTQWWTPRWMSNLLTCSLTYVIPCANLCALARDQLSINSSPIHEVNLIISDDKTIIITWNYWIIQTSLMRMLINVYQLSGFFYQEHLFTCKIELIEW